MYSTLKTYLILFGGVFALSTSAIFVKLSEASSFVTAFYRLFLAAAILAPFCVFSANYRAEIKNLRKSQWKQCLIAGALLAFHYLLWFESMNYTSVASSIVLVSLQPLFSLAIERFVSKKKIKSTAIIGCFIALFGCVIIGAGDFQISGLSLLGDFIAFFAAGVIALYFFIGETARKEMSALSYSTLTYFFSAVILFVCILIRNESFTDYLGQTWFALVGIAVVSTIGGQFVFNLLLKHIPASAVTMSILGEPVGTCILAFFILGERIVFQQFLGILIIILGIGVFFFTPSRAKS